MKRETIETLLKEAGVVEDKMKTAVDGVMAENDKDIEAEHARTTAETAKLTAANNTIKELQEAAKKYDGKDPDKLKEDLDALQRKYDEDIAAEQKKASDVRKEFSLKEALRGAGVVDPEYLIYKHGGLEKFAFSEDKPIGMEDILKPYKESSPHLFVDGANGGSQTTTIRKDSGKYHGGGGDGLDFDSMSDDEFYKAKTKKEE